jgi:hypothetical protein
MTIGLALVDMMATEVASGFDADTRVAGVMQHQCRRTYRRKDFANIDLMVHPDQGNHRGRARAQSLDARQRTPKYRVRRAARLQDFGRYSSAPALLMPRMPMNERREMLERRLARLGMSISGDGKWKILSLSKGLPAYVHTLGKFAVFTEEDVDSAINEGLQSSRQSLKDSYEAATRSNNTRA